MSHSRILIQAMSFKIHTDTAIFTNLNLVFSTQKTGLVGRNGIGKSTLIKLITGELSPSSGTIRIEGTIAYVPQSVHLVTNMTVAGLLGYQDKIQALHRIQHGSVDEHDYTIINDDWSIEERISQQLNALGLGELSMDQSMAMLSGGEVTRLLLAKAFLADADFLLFDEPTNHLDRTSRQQLYQAIKQWQKGLIVISHDRTLLNLMDEIIELTSLGASCYGGNYDAYQNQKDIEKLAKQLQLHDAKRLLKKTKTTIQSSHEKHEKKQSYGRKLRRSGSIDKMTANSKKGRSERSQSKMLIKEERLMNQAETQLQTAKEKIDISEEIHVDLPATKVPNGKIIVEIEDLCFSYPNSNNTIIQHLDLLIQGPQRIALVGNNGSGKTTLIKLLLKELQPQSGKIYIGTDYVRYLDQNTSLLKSDLSILANFLLLNPDANENDSYRCLAQFLFRNTQANKLVKNLSGGEKLRALLACVLMSKQPPQLLILDEPTNHLDLQSVNGIESALKNYQGAMIVISHDERFLKTIEITGFVYAPFKK